MDVCIHIWWTLRRGRGGEKESPDMHKKGLAMCHPDACFNHCLLALADSKMVSFLVLGSSVWSSRSQPTASFSHQLAVCYFSNQAGSVSWTHKNYSHHFSSADSIRAASQRWKKSKKKQATGEQGKLRAVEGAEPLFEIMKDLCRRLRKGVTKMWRRCRGYISEPLVAYGWEWEWNGGFYAWATIKQYWDRYYGCFRLLV